MIKTDVIDAKIETRPAFTAAGLVHRGKPGNPELPRLWEQLMGAMHGMKGIRRMNVCYGICSNVDEQTQEFDYMAAYEVEPGVEQPDGVQSWEIPGQTYAVFSTTLPDIGATYEYVYDQWMPASEYRHGAGPELELYGEHFNPEDPNSELKLYIPVEKK